MRSGSSRGDEVEELNESFVGLGRTLVATEKDKMVSSKISHHEMRGLAHAYVL